MDWKLARPSIGGCTITSEAPSEEDRYSCGLKVVPNRAGAVYFDRGELRSNPKRIGDHTAPLRQTTTRSSRHDSKRMGKPSRAGDLLAII